MSKDVLINSPRGTEFPNVHVLTCIIYSFSADISSFSESNLVSRSSV